MKLVHRNHCLGKPRDDGFSLVEVIVAIAIISIVALASASLTINGVALASSTERQQLAVTIASGALETASAQSVATIYSGRNQSAVNAAFTANSTVPGVAATNQAWDTTTSPPAAEALPITLAPVTQSGTTYKTTVLVGSCYQPRAGGDCVKVLAGGIPLIRVIAVVRWTAGKTCAAGACYYSATTLLDPASDLKWVTHG